VQTVYPKVLGFSPDGRYLVVTGAEYVESGYAKSAAATLLATADGTEVARVMHRDLISGVAFDPSGRLLATASHDRTVRLFDIGSLRPIDLIQHADRVGAVAFSLDGQYLATASLDGVLILSSVAAKARVARHLHGSAISAIAFSPNGHWIATGSWDGTARLTETTTGAELARMTHGALVHIVMFSSDGRYLATASRDGTAAVHWTEPQRMFDVLCQPAGRNLNRAEWKEVFREDEPWQSTCPGWRNQDGE
jgi:WD40 repeat protein